MERTADGEEVEMTSGLSTNSEKKQKDLELARTKSLENQVSLLRECLIVILISLAQFLTQTALGQTIVLVHVIGDHYGITDPGVLSWFIAGYSLTVGTFIIFSGRLGDIFGWKKMLIFGYAWFATWTTISGLAWYSNHILFICMCAFTSYSFRYHSKAHAGFGQNQSDADLDAVSRVFAGIGPAICLPNGLAMLGALYQPGKRKNMAFAVFGGCAPAGGIAGFTIGGLFNLAWWPCNSFLVPRSMCTCANSWEGLSGSLALP